MISLNVSRIFIVAKQMHNIAVKVFNSRKRASIVRNPLEDLRPMWSPCHSFLPGLPLLIIR
jgi:hypothetical protein